MDILHTLDFGLYRPVRPDPSEPGCDLVAALGAVAAKPHAKAWREWEKKERRGG